MLLDKIGLGIEVPSLGCFNLPGRHRLIDKPIRPTINHKRSLFQHFFGKPSSEFIQFAVHQKLGAAIRSLHMIIVLQVATQSLNFLRVFGFELDQNILPISFLGLVHLDPPVLLLVDHASPFHQHLSSLPADIFDEHLQLNMLVLQIHVVLPKPIYLVSYYADAVVQLAYLSALEP